MQHGFGILLCTPVLPTPRWRLMERHSGTVPFSAGPPNRAWKGKVWHPPPSAVPPSVCPTHRAGRRTKETNHGRCTFE